MAVAALGTTLCDIHGIGPIGAATILGSVGDIARFPTASGRDFDQSQYFDGVIVRGKSANLDITTTSDGRQVETRESWSFVDGGLRQDSRVYSQVDCSAVVPTFDDPAEG